jgi:WD40 repeat protein
MGGFYDGKIVIYSLEGKTSYEKIPFNDDCPILSLCLDQDEEYLFVGNSQGNVAVYKITQDINKWEKINCLYDHKKEISHIHCNSDLSLWVSTSINGYINLYTLPLCKLARTIKINSPKCCYAFLSSSPLPSIVVISEETGSKIIVYSINGKMIKKPNLLNFKLKNPIIIKDLNSNEYLCYIGLKTITIHSLPNLEPKVNVDINSGIYTIFTSEDKRSLYCLNKNGSQVCIIKDEIKKALRSPSTIVM